jgi:hypothetical protein
LLKYLLLYLVKHPNFDLMHSIFFSQSVFDEFIAKRGDLVELLLIGWLREET